MNAAEMQWRSPSGDQPILAMTGSFILLFSYRISLRRAALALARREKQHSSALVWVRRNE